MFDDFGDEMKTQVKCQSAASSWKAVSPRRTYDHGFREDCQGAGMDVRNGRMFEKTLRKQIFLNIKKS
jgi:hypothetical protein